MWKMIQECWGQDPRTRPTIKEVQRFLEPIFQKWTTPTSGEVDGLGFDSSAVANTDSSTSLYARMCSSVKDCYLR